METTLAILANDQGTAVTVEHLASSLNLSASRLRHLFKREVGIPVGAFIRASRMERARRLLDTSLLSVKELTYELGLTDETYFIREFKRAWGKTPALYRHESATSAEQLGKPTNSHSAR